MFREIQIGDKTVGMIANGATPIRYRMVFGKDIISEIQSLDRGETGKVTLAMSELAYIMAMAAESADGKANMDKLEQSSFVKWLEQFEPLDITNASEDIVDLYMGNQKTASESKKKVKG